MNINEHPEKFDTVAGRWHRSVSRAGTHEATFYWTLSVTRMSLLLYFPPRVRFRCPWKPFPTISPLGVSHLWSYRTVAQLSRWLISFEPRQKHGCLATFEWEGSRCCQKRARFTFLSPDKIDAFSLPPAHQLLLVRTAIEKLTSSKQNKWQNATKGGEWTRPNGVVFEEDLPLGPLPPKQGEGRKRGPWYGSLLGNWGSYVWNVSLCVYVVSHPASPLAIGHTICLCSQCLNYVFLFDKERKKMWCPWSRTTSWHFECVCQIAI